MNVCKSASLFLFFVLLFVLTGGSFAAQVPDAKSLEQLQSLPADVQEKLKEQYLGSQQSVVSQTIDPVEPETVVVAPPPIPEDSSVSPLEKQFRERYQSTLAGGLEQFGYNLFAHASGAVLQNIVPSQDYVVVPGDQVRIRLWGATDDVQYLARIEPDGTINVPKIGVISVAGERLDTLGALILEEALNYMQGINVSVALEKLHSVEVYVIGEVANPGLHVVPAFSTLFKGLQAAGGIKKSGSLRSIGLYRDNRQASSFDLYDLIIDGNRSGDQVLRNGDVIFVPRIGETVAVAGAVYQPGIYEVLQAKNVSQVLEYAGGTLPNAYSQSLYIKRYDLNNAFQVVDLRSHHPDVLNRNPVRSGDLLEIPFAPVTPATAVVLEGHVKVPQTFAFAEGLRLSDVLRGVDDLKPEALTEYALLHRYNEQTTRYELQKFPLAQFLVGSFDLGLKPYDKIEILSRGELGIKETVTISGAIWRPGTYAYMPSLTVADLLALAGGIKDHEYMQGNAYLYRYDADSLKYDVRRIDVAQALQDENLYPLQPFDKVELLSRTDYNFDEPVRIDGAVRKPGEFTWRKSMTVRDLIDLAGGTTFGAQPERVEVSRIAIEEGESKTTHFIVSPQQQAEMVLQPYDSVHMPVVKDATKVARVTISGEVLYPGTYSVKDGEHLSDVIRRAGGFTDLAYYYGARFTSEKSRQIQQASIDKMIARLQLQARREISETSEVVLAGDSVQAAQLQADAAGRLLAELQKVRAEGRVSMLLAPLSEFTGSLHDFTVHDGDSLQVPQRPGFVSVVGSVYSPNSFLYQPGKTIGDYLAMSGGPTKEADEDYIYVQKANGEVLSAQQSGVFSRFYSQELMPGDAIVVMENLERVPALRLFKDITEIVFRIATTAGIAFAI